jgi:esterase
VGASADLPDDLDGNIRQIRGGEGELSVVEWGHPGQPTVVLLHGLRGYARWFEEVAHSLASEHFVVACDLRGRGNSSNSPTGDYRVDVLVDDLEDVIGSYGSDPVILAGHSLGGLVALLYAGRHPSRVSQLVLVDAGPEVDPRGLERIKGEVRATPPSFDSWDAAVAYVATMHPARGEQRARSRRDGMLRTGPDGRVTWRLDPAVYGNPAIEPAWRAWRALDRVTCPTLVVRGADSDIISAHAAELMLARLPDGSSRTDVPGAGHMVLDDAPDVATAAITDFLRPADHSPAPVEAHS